MKQISGKYLFLIPLLLLFNSNLSARALPDFSLLVEKHSPAVVNISTIKKNPGIDSNSPAMPEIPEDSPFYDFFNKYFEQTPRGGQPFTERSSLGSGFIISKDGYVITNNHVVENADEIIVGLKDRRELVATLVGTDKRSDIAVLKITGEDFPTLELGDSDKMKVGEWVLAIGSPFGFNHSVTAGIVSAMGRALPNENYTPFIQTDVAINPGNSGGPLFNLEGEVIGVNSQIYSRTGGFMGLSFAVPIDVVLNVYNQIREQGHVSRGWLGVLIQEVTRELAESFAMEKPQGALVVKVLPDSPAEKSGFEVGDVVVKFDNKEIGFRSDLPPIVGNSLIGSKVAVQIIRRGKKRTLKVEIEKLPGEEELKVAAASNIMEQAGNRLNITLKDLSASQRKKLELTDYGVLVEKVGEGPAREAGIRAGDVILLLNNQKLIESTQLSTILSDLPVNKSIPVLIQRRGNPVFLALKMTDDS
ncbi:MAG: Do family serine endopeptidase [Gammaproteobacteria bacterium]|nr:Do family serine endopeptidase [Gammaproteobacteria bacterium]